MAAEVAGQGELSQLVTHHVLGAEHVRELASVVDLERVTHELGNDRARPSPGLDGGPATGLLHLHDLAEQLLVHERAFFQ